MGAWAPLVPFAKARGQLDEAQLGFLLLCLGAGSLLTMPVTGPLTSRLGCRAVITGAIAVICGTLPLLGSVSSPIILAAALFAFGAGVGTADVAMNINAVIVERASGRALMPGFHGMYSVGGIVGAGWSTAVLALHGSAAVAAISAAAAIAVLLAVAKGKLLPYAGDPGGPPFAIPRGVVWVLGVLCFIAFLAEGAVLDWSAVFLSQVKAIPTAQAGLGYALFAVTMALGRLNGNRVIGVLGGGKTLLSGAGLAAAGLALAVVLPWPGVCLLCFPLMGVGLANIAPVLFTAAGRQRVMPVELAISSVTTMGYAGILIGPAAIGYVAKGASLGVGLLGLAVTLLAAGFAGGWACGGMDQASD